MAIHQIRDKYKIYKAEKSAEVRFRKELSRLLIDQYGKGPFIQEQIQTIITYCLNYYIDHFKNICIEEQHFYFYQFVFMLHEDAVELAVLHKSKLNSNNISGEYFSIYRRILKFILETACDVNIVIKKPGPNALKEIYQTLDELIFLGDMILACVSSYAEQSMIEDVCEIQFDKNDLYVFSRRHHYNFVFDQIINEWTTNVEKVVVDTNFDDLFQAVHRCFGIHYQDVGHLIADIHTQHHFTNGFNWDALPSNLGRLFSIPYSIAEQFFKGLTLDKHNKMSLLDLACRPYNMNRYLYRPIIIWNVNGKDFAFCGKNAWTEAIIQLISNAIPWGKASVEWMNNDCFKRYVHTKENDHDKWLDDAAEKILEKENCFFDRNIKKLKNGIDSVNIDVKDLGEIDFVIIVPEIKKILVTDCKHLLTRYDAVNMKNDFNAFTKPSGKKKSYNQTMNNKTTWFEANKSVVQSHFRLKYDQPDLNLDEYRVEGIFIINTPTLYMYSSKYRIYTIDQLQRVIRGNFAGKKYLVHIDNESESRIINVTYPYFKKPVTRNIVDPFGSSAKN
ncbi:MAG TPA: hypothetical protein VG367_03515 [Mucilaginibacter sp.]|jgi:hypothetical protein|nr:hypothetical protein [Mucilaginibacter sp.]